MTTTSDDASCECEKSYPLTHSGVETRGTD